MISQSKKEEKNRFCCWVCGQETKRGTPWFKIEKGPRKGFPIKTCQSEFCIERAKNGILHNRSEEE